MSASHEHPGNTSRWPVGTLAQIRAVESLLQYAGAPLTRAQVDRYFGGAPAGELDATLRYLVDVGLVLEAEGRYGLPPPRA